MFVNRHTGAPISEREQILQSIDVILTTPIGSRVMRRDFGSRLPDLIDSGIHPAGVTAVYAAVNESIARWEPRAQIIRTRLDISEVEDGILKLVLDLRILGGQEIQPHEIIFRIQETDVPDIIGTLLTIDNEFTTIGNTLF